MGININGRNFDTFYLDDKTKKNYIWDDVGRKFIEVEFEGGGGGSGSDSSDGDHPYTKQDQGSGQDQQQGSGQGQGGQSGQSNQSSAGKEDSKGDDGGSKPLKIGDKGDDAFQKSEREKRDAQVAKEKEGARAAGGSANPDGSKEKDPIADEEARLKRIQQHRNDPRFFDKLKAASGSAKHKEQVAKEARKKPSYFTGGLPEFKLSIEKFIRDQIGYDRGYSWSEYDEYNTVPGVLSQGSSRKASAKIPSINVYVDQSGSFDTRDIAVANQAIEVLRKYEKAGKITIHIYYFATRVFTSDKKARADGGTAYRPIQEHIEQTNPSNVVILTDDGASDAAGTTVVKGGAWTMIRGASDVTNLSCRDHIAAHLKGLQFTGRFTLEGD